MPPTIAPVTLQPVHAAPHQTKRHALVHLLVCHGCCCGQTEKGKPPVPLVWLKATYKARKLMPRVQLTITGCLGPCDVANVVGVLTEGHAVWLGAITEQTQYEGLFDWATRCAADNTLAPLPDSFAPHRIDRWAVTDPVTLCPTP